MNKNFEIEAIDDVNKGIYRYIKQRWGWKFFLPAVLLILLAAAGVYYLEDILAVKLILAPLLWIVAGIGIASSKIREAFMRQFASQNNFTYMGSGGTNSVIGALFQRGNDREIANMVIGSRGGYGLRFFLFYYTVGNGKNKETYVYTVCEIKMKGQSPDIVVESRDDWDFQSYAGEDKKEILMESAFRKHFAVFAPEDFEIETLEILTPDVLSELMNRAKSYNFEFIENRLYIFRFGRISKRAELEELLELAEYLVGTVAGKVFRLSDDVLALKEAKIRNDSR